MSLFFDHRLRPVYLHMDSHKSRGKRSAFMKASYAVVDLFAGPGGLAEGFANVRQDDHRPYSIVLSVEKDEHAHKTLLLRSFLRQFEGAFQPNTISF